MLAVILLAVMPIHTGQPEIEALRLIGKALGTIGEDANVHHPPRTDLASLVPFRPKTRGKSSSLQNPRPTQPLTRTERNYLATRCLLQD